MTARPFLKWPGGKTQLLPELRKLYPPATAFARYLEPFVGAGSVFFDLAAQGVLAGKECFLSDANDELTSTYQIVRDQAADLSNLLRDHATKHKVDAKTHYYEVRALRPSNRLPEAARMIYLNKTCFNGLYRVNAAGGFNVSLGDYENPTICDEENLWACSKALAGASIFQEDYRGCYQRAQEGDFIYFDPPYVPVSDTANFTSYTAEGFGPSDQAGLAKILRKLDDLGCLLLLSQADSPRARDLYDGFHIHAVEAKRNINRNGKKRGKVGEIIVCNEALKRALESRP
jgi:DNA adenine methylase